MSIVEFGMSKVEAKNFNEWNTKHNKTCPFKNGKSQGAIGGRLTYSFTPTSLGTVVVVECACGKKENLTDFDVW